jgi:hypothetical protein
MKFLHKDSEVLSDIKSSAFKLLGTFYGGIAFESFTKNKSLSTPVKTKDSEFADLGSLFFKKAIPESEPIYPTINVPDPDIKEDNFMDFSFKRARNNEPLKVSAIEEKLTEKPANINPISVSEKLLKLKNENIDNVQSFLRMDVNYYQEQIQRSFSDPNKNIVDKLHDFCDIAESLSRSSNGFISELRSEKVSIDETIRIQNEIGSIIDNNLNKLVSSEKPTTKIKMKMY